MFFIFSVIEDIINYYNPQQKYEFPSSVEIYYEYAKKKKYVTDLLKIVAVKQVLNRYKCLIELHDKIKYNKYCTFSIFLKIKLLDEIRKFNKNQLGKIGEEARIRYFVNKLFKQKLYSMKNSFLFFKKLKEELKIKLCNYECYNYNNYNYEFAFKKLLIQKYVFPQYILVINNSLLILSLFLLANNNTSKLLIIAGSLAINYNYTYNFYKLLNSNDALFFSKKTNDKYDFSN